MDKAPWIPWRQVVFLRDDLGDDELSQAVVAPTCTTCRCKSVSLLLSKIRNCFIHDYSS